jgi:hypothetical protein
VISKQPMRKLQTTSPATHRAQLLRTHPHEKKNEILEGRAKQLPAGTRQGDTE